MADQGRAPLLEALEAYHESDPVSFSIPAHKAGRSLDELTRAVLGEGPYRADAPAHKGLDDRTSSYGVQSFAQQLAAAAFGADQALFSTNGSTLSVQIAVMAATHPGQQVAVARNVHKSVISGLIVSGAEPVFVDPVYDDEHALAHTVTPNALEAALNAHPDVKAMLAVSPTVAGVAADVAALAETRHAHGIPLIMDDAWGADFGFHPELPPGSMEAGADLAIASFHKSLTGLMQTSIILGQGDRIDTERLTLALDGFETTSTSALLIASMDAARRAMALHGEELLSKALTLSRRGGEEIDALPGIRLLGPELDGREGVAGRDETKILVDVSGLGISGFQAADWLYEQRRVGAEHHDLHHLMFIVTVADDDATVDRLVAAMRDLVDAAPQIGAGHPLPTLPPVSQLVGDYAMPPREAFLGTTRRVDLVDAAGEIAAEPVSPYPPGVPLLVRASASMRGISSSCARASTPACTSKGSATPRSTSSASWPLPSGCARRSRAHALLVFERSSTPMSASPPLGRSVRRQRGRGHRAVTGPKALPLAARRVRGGAQDGEGARKGGPGPRRDHPPVAQGRTQEFVNR